MPKSNIEKQLEKLQKENKRQQAEDKKQAIKAEIRERASSIVNGQPIIKGLRIKLLSPFTMAVKELPIRTPTAISTTFPRVMKALNSLKNFFMI